MSQHRKKKSTAAIWDSNRGMVPIMILFLLVLIILAAFIVRRNRRIAEAEAALEPGITYLEQLEAKDPEDVNVLLRQYQQEQMQEQKEEMQRQIESGELSVWSLFEDYVLLGDSRAVGFWTFNYLPQELVLADGGDTIRELQGHIDDIVRIDPARIFLCYGLNDVSIGYWESKEDYVAEFTETLQEIQSKVPGIEIYVSSILPANEAGIATMSKWAEIPEFNVAIKEMCKNMDGVVYVDNDDICEAHSDMWETDGVHVFKEFYPYWAGNMIIEVYNYATEDTENVSAGEVSSTTDSSDDAGDSAEDNSGDAEDETENRSESTEADEEDAS